MLKPQLFLGLAVTEAFTQAWDLLDPKLIDLFTLEKISWGGQVYLGKSAGDICDLAQLDLLEGHIYSLLKKLLPDYPCAQTPLSLFAVQR